MKLTILCVGKKHDPLYKEAIAHFESRITPFAKLEWRILPHSQSGDNRASEMESTQIMERISKRDYVVLLDERGTNTASEKLADIIDQAQTHSQDCVFIIGGAYGVSDALRQRANVTVAFGTSVFPHQLMRLMVVEQIYRALSINAGSHYHHE